MTVSIFNAVSYSRGGRHVYQFNRGHDAGHTILDLADSRLEVIQGQVADLLLEIGEIHNAISTSAILRTIYRINNIERDKSREFVEGWTMRESRNQSTWQRRWAPSQPPGHVAAPELQDKARRRHHRICYSLINGRAPLR